MKKGLNAVCYETQMHIYFERVASFGEGDFYEITLSNGQSVQTKKTNVSFFDLKQETSYQAELFLCLNGEKKLLDKATFTTKGNKERIDVTKAPYFAVGDGETLNTKALQKALDEAGERVVYFPNGKYLTGALTLHSGTELYLEADAVILGSADPKDYLPLVSSRSEGYHMNCFQSLINVGELDKDSGCTTKDITIRGGSIIGGSFALMDSMKHSAVKFAGEYIDATDENKVLAFSKRTRGKLIEMRNTENIVISDVNLGKGPYWNVHFIYCENIIVHHCNINTRGISNGDGIDPDSCENVTVFDCDFDTGDNCIAIKSGRDMEGILINRPCKHIRIFDVKCTGGSIAIGSELSGGCEDIVAWNMDLSNSIFGFGIKTNRKRAGVIKDVYVYDSVMPNIRLDATYYDTKERAKELTKLQNISYDNCVILGEGYKIFYGEENINKVQKVDLPSVIFIGFEEEQTFKNIKFSNLKLKKKADGAHHIFEIRNIPNTDFGTFETIE